MCREPAPYAHRCHWTARTDTGGSAARSECGTGGPGTRQPAFGRDTARTPWQPGGLTVGASYFSYRDGGVSFVSGGLMPSFGLGGITPRLGVTAGFAF